MDYEVINYLDHPHQLKLVPMNRYAKCQVCVTDVSKVFAFDCGTGSCPYVVCRKCAKLPSQVKHPFHPQHSIFLHKITSYDHCRACGLTVYNYLYKCWQCEFCLDITCATLMPTLKESAVMKHQHPLIVCDYPKDSDRKQVWCRLCKEPFGMDDLIYFCLECISIMDKNCAAQPSELKHPFHPEHNLTLLPSRPPISSSHCIACSNYLNFKEVVYYCSTCGICIDFRCASLLPVLENFGPEVFTHPHPLIPCNNSRKNFHSECYGCGLPFKDTNTIYVCLECGILLHKLCADLPSKISHHFHPQHPLILKKNSFDDKWRSGLECGGCRDGHGGFFYVCQNCDFLLDIRCATADLLKIVNSAVHLHSLALFDFNFRLCQCAICHFFLDKNGFRCVPCNFNIHDHCLPSLPKTIKHECHCDPLTFTTNKLKAYPDEDEDEDEDMHVYIHGYKELYCNACEDKRDIRHPTYYCAECHFVAHIRCVISEILPHQEIEKIASEKLVQEVEKMAINEQTSVNNEISNPKINRLFEELGRVIKLLLRQGNDEEEKKKISEKVQQLVDQMNEPEVKANTTKVDDELKDKELTEKKKEMKEVIEKMKNELQQREAQATSAEAIEKLS